MTFEQVAYETRRQLALRLRSLRLHKIDLLRRETGDWVHKRRKRFGRIAVMLGNVYLRLQGANVYILADLDWIGWEREVELAMRGDADTGADISDPSRALWSNANRIVHIRRHFPGVTLKQILSDSMLDMKQKMSAIDVAFRSLQKLHAKSAAWKNGLTQTISHGDATCENVILDLQFQTATWIDFEMRHLESMDANERQADDARALIFSSAAIMKMENYRPLLESVIFADWPTDLREGYSRLLSSQWQHPITFQLAQAPLKWHEHKYFIGLQQEILRGIASRTLVASSAP